MTAAAAVAAPVPRTTASFPAAFAPLVAATVFPSVAAADGCIQVCRAHCSAAVLNRYSASLKLQEEDLDFPRLTLFSPLLQLARQIDCSAVTTPGSVSPLVRNFLADAAVAAAFAAVFDAAAFAADGVDYYYCLSF
mgnify:CR=1 FL=1